MPKRPDPSLKIIEYQGLEVVPAGERAPRVPSLIPVIDSRWLRVQEFLRSRELAATTLKAYEGELKRFSNWTPKAWHQV